MKRLLALLLSTVVPFPLPAAAQYGVATAPAAPTGAGVPVVAGVAPQVQAAPAPGVSFSAPSVAMSPTGLRFVTTPALVGSSIRPQRPPSYTSGTGAAEKGSNPIKKAELALAGDAEAGKELPATEALGTPVAATNDNDSGADQREAATQAFETKLGAKTGETRTVDAEGAQAKAPAAVLERPSVLDRDRAKPLPEPNLVPSPLPDLDSSVDMWVTHSYPGAPGKDSTEWAVEAVGEYIAFDGMPNSQKHLVLKFFEIGKRADRDSKLIEAIRRLQEAGIQTTILTDLNQSLSGKFEKDENRHTRFAKADYKGSGPGRGLKVLVEELGFSYQYGKGKYAVLSGVPLFNPETQGQKPLMHDKGIFALGPDGKAYRFAYMGTANMNAIEDVTQGEFPAYGGRYNRLIRSRDPSANQVDWDHVLAEIEAYDARKGYTGLGDELDVPQRVSYPNGEFRELAFTNGVQNPNERQVYILDRATKALKEALERRKAGDANAKPSFEVTEVIFSDFVLTYLPVVEGTRAWLAAALAFYGKDDLKNHVKIRGVFDQKFIAPDGWGAAAAMDGILVQRPMGKGVFPYRSEFVEVIDIRAFIRLLDGVDKIDPDGVPSGVHLWHDKTTILKTIERDAVGRETRWVEAFTRSLNNSGAFKNLESQDWYHMRTDSKLARQFEDSIVLVIENEPEFAREFDVAVVMTVLARVSHHTIYDDGMYEAAKAMIAALSSEKYDAVEKIIESVLALPTKHAVPFDLSTLAEGTARFVSFLHWYAESAEKDRSLNRMTYRKAINIALGVAGKDPWDLKTALDILYWKPGQDRADRERLMRHAWENGLKMKERFPGAQSDKGEPVAPSA